MDWRHHIVATPEIRSGQPRLYGTIITVKDVLGNLASGMTPAEIVDEFPPLTVEHIRACLAYAADHVSA